MNVLIKTFLVIISLVSLSLLSASPAVAQDNSQARERVANRCTIVTQRVDLITSRYEQNKNRHVERYQNIYQKVTELVTRLENEGYDVEDLKASLGELNQKVREFAYEYNQVIKELNDSKNHVCGNNEGEYKQAITRARNNLLKAREKALEIRIMINDEIKPELRALLNTSRSN